MLLKRSRAVSAVAVTAGLFGAALSLAPPAAANLPVGCSMTPSLDGDWCTSSTSERHVNQGLLPALVQAFAVCHVDGDPTEIDGYFGPASSQLVSDAQRHLNAEGHRLVVDGQAGPGTVAAMLDDRRLLGRTLDDDAKVIERFALADTGCVVEAYAGTGIIVHVSDGLETQRGVIDEGDVRTKKVTCGFGLFGVAVATVGIVGTVATAGVGTPFFLAAGTGAVTAGGAGLACGEAEKAAAELAVATSDLPGFGRSGDFPQGDCRNTNRLGEVKSDRFGVIEAHQSSKVGCGVYLFISMKLDAAKTFFLVLHNSTSVNVESRIGVVRARVDGAGRYRSQMAIDDGRIKAVEVCWAKSGGPAPSSASIMAGTNAALRCFGPYRV